MKFKAFDKLKNKYVSNVVIDHNGKPHMIDTSYDLNILINSNYYKKNKDDNSLLGRYCLYNKNNNYAEKNIIIEWFNEETKE